MNKALALVVLSAVSLPVSGHAHEVDVHVYGTFLPCLDDVSHLRLGVISNGRSREQVRKLVNLGIHNRFEVVVVSEEVGTAKPDPGIFDHACEAMGVPPGHAVYVGDQYDLDASAAVSAGLRGIWLNRSGAARPVCEVPSIRSLEDLVSSAGLESRPAM